MMTTATPFTRASRLAQLDRIAAERIMILDGAMGTEIQKFRLVEADYRGTRFANWPKELKGNNDLLNLTRPDVIRTLEQRYLEAGADIIETNTFSCTRVAMADYGMESLAAELAESGARIARTLCDEFEARDGRPRYVAGVLGP